MSKVISQLRQEHVEMSNFLDLLNKELDVYSNGRPPNFELVHHLVTYFLDYPDQIHHPRENSIYKVIQQRDATLARAVAGLERDHIHFAAKTRVLADVVRGSLAEGTADRDWVRQMAKEYVRSYRRHIKWEEDHVFPAAETVLSEADWERIEESYGRTLTLKVSEQASERFRQIRDDISSLSHAVG